MEFGSKVSKALEEGKDTGDALVDAVVALLPAYSLREHEIRVTLKTPSGTVDLLGRLDTFDPVAPRFREYKTGRTQWDQNKAKKHRQMPHYGTLVYLKYSKLPTEAWLDWAETELDDNGDVRFTGNLKSFHVKLGMQEILEYMALVSKVATEIDGAYRAELQKLS